MSTHPGTSSGEETALGEQFSLFDVGMNISELRSERELTVTYSRAANTVRGYAFSWVVFARWCETAGLQSLPASPDTVSLFVIWACKKRKPKAYKLTNVTHIVSAIQDRHRSERLPNPVNELVRETLAGIARTVEQEPGAKAALTPDCLRRVVGEIAGDSPIAVRDRGILLVGFATGWRSAELSALHLREVRFYPDHMLFRLRKSKTDQLGKGREVRIPRVPDSPLCPVAALEAWIKVRGNKPGSLFLPFRGLRRTPTEDGVIGPQVIRSVVKRHLRRAGIDPRNYGAHSLRSGMVTTAAENGADVISIQERTGHERLETIARYVRSAGGFRRDPLAGVFAKTKGDTAA